MNERETDVAPPARDGRNIDQALGSLRGEGAQQRVARPAAEAAALAHEAAAPTYYGMPALKAPVWRWYVPAYFYVGGVAGASAAVGAAALLRRDELAQLSRATRYVAAAGATLSGALLIADLGRPARFLYMLRVFRPTSPMNLGTWILSAFGATSTAAVVWPKALFAAGVLGLPLSSYTGVLVSNTAVPLWAAVHRSLPPLFVSSAATAAGSLLQLVPLDVPSRRVARRLTIAGAAAELACGFFVDAEASAVPEVARPLRHGVSGALWKASKALTLAALGASLLAGRRRSVGITAGVLGTLGSLALRFAIVHAGTASAKDPEATFAQQRRSTPSDAARAT